MHNFVDPLSSHETDVRYFLVLQRSNLITTVGKQRNVGSTLNEERVLLATKKGLAVAGPAGPGATALH